MNVFSDLNIEKMCVKAVDVNQGGATVPRDSPPVKDGCRTEERDCKWMGGNGC